MENSDSTILIYARACRLWTGRDAGKTGHKTTAESWTNWRIPHFLPRIVAT